MSRILITFFILMCMSVQAQEGNSNPFKVYSNVIHEVKIFNHGLSSFEERLRLIESAKETIDVEYFTMKSDLSSRIFLQALLKKQAAGVRIRLLVDHTFSAPAFNPSIASELIKKGIEVKYFNPISKRKMLKVQYRNHRKSLIIDSEIMMTGGRNIADEYFDLSPRFKFLDRDIVIKGEIVKEIQKTFDETYHSKLSVNALDILKQDKKILEKEALARDFLFKKVEERRYLEIRKFASNEYQKTKIEGTCNSVSFVSEFPDLGSENKKYNRQVKFDLEERLKSATHEVVIDSPYFITDRLFKSVFNEILSKGVEVKLLTNSLNSTDVPIGAAAFDREVMGWIEKGMKPYVYKGNRPSDYEVMKDFNEDSKFAVHAKTLIFDSKDTYIGSYNLDPRSANYNTELMIGCEDSPDIAMKVKADIEKRMEGAIALDSKEAFKEAKFYLINFSKKMKYYASIIPAMLFKGWL